MELFNKIYYFTLVQIRTVCVCEMKLLLYILELYMFAA